MNKAEWFELFSTPAILWMNLLSRIFDMPWRYLIGAKIVNGSLMREIQRRVDCGEDKL